MRAASGEHTGGGQLDLSDEPPRLVGQFSCTYGVRNLSAYGVRNLGAYGVRNCSACGVRNF